MMARTHLAFVVLCILFFFFFHLLHGELAPDKKQNEKQKEHYAGPYQIPESCDYHSCYPATGDLLIGRETNLSASSTCGLRGKERFCIVSHLESKKKCFNCDSTSKGKGLSHRIENIVYKLDGGKKTWWQSENGKEDVSVRLDLETEFHFTHIIMKFKTFRPAAMLIERSHDFGHTWHVYRYFAHDCHSSFPGVPLGPPRSFDDVICESRYSDVAPSTRGELIFRVLPPNLPVKDPFGPEVQRLLKMTNLRINFTKLHTLGDNLLDQRAEIKEKYYYALYNVVVRGSCSCYGHASRCVPVYPGTYPPDMVHGRCECTHRTQGLNCEKCQDLYNDLPWQPARGAQINACKKCNCHGHATRCHFDESVYNYTGNVSGGVCDDCQHNTMGVQCEQCAHFYYRDYSRDITDSFTCLPCDCDPRGSLDNGLCDPMTDAEYQYEAGRCYCKAHVTGRRCDRCREGFWNFEQSNPNGCEECTCNKLGTISGHGCNQYTGECTCKRYVTGRDCNQCLSEYWGLSEDRDGCHPCDCDVGGAFDNHCDVIVGLCRCRPHITGRRCGRTDQGYFVGLLDYFVYEAEGARICDNCHMIMREPFTDRDTTWTGLGFMRMFEGSKIEFEIDNIETTMKYDIAIRYEPQTLRNWDEAHVKIERQEPVDLDACRYWSAADDFKRTTLPSGDRHVVVYPPVCLERGKSYKFIIELRRYDNQVETPTATILIDSIVLIPLMEDIPFFQGTVSNEHRRQEFERFRCDQNFAQVGKRQISEICKKYLFSIGVYVYGEGLECNCDLTGSTSSICDSLGGQCPCKSNIVGRRCDRCAPGTYGFSPSGCRACDCDSVGALDNFCDGLTGQCKCRPNTYGRQCDECQPGFWNYPNCVRCECNGHADTCDSRTGECTECRDYTTGKQCESCLTGHYGDPRSGVNIPCRPCPCPGLADTGHSYAETCYLDGYLQTVVCNCKEGYAGERCDRCANNYFGNPETPGGRCEKCSCNNNIDVFRPDNCDAKTGECLQCLFSTEGFNCERCKSGFYGDAIHQLCRECVCNILGTDPQAGPCNRITGQCPCLPNVIGLECDQCEKNHWNLANGTGCKPCDCDPYGSTDEQCNPFDGQCDCKSGFGGRQCNECQQNYWGNPNIECHACNCDRSGSATLQCDRNNGLCMCLPGIGGDRCDQCARGYVGNAPYCDKCGECFDNWDIIIGELRDETNRLVEIAQKIQITGTSGVYTEEFNEIERKIEKIYALLHNATGLGVNLEGLNKLIESIRTELQKNKDYYDAVDDRVENTTNRVSNANLELEDLKNLLKTIAAEAEDLKKRATELRQSDVDGALNITREMRIRSQAAQSKVEYSITFIADSKRERQRAEQIIQQGELFFNQSLAQNNAAIEDIMNILEGLEEEMPKLNEMVCDGRGDPCDFSCGGAGCDKCGGLGCDDGASTMAENALSLAEDTDKLIRQKEKLLNEMHSNILQVQTDAHIARKESQLAYDKASTIGNQSAESRIDLDNLLTDIQDFLKADTAKPQDIRQLAEEVFNKSISLDPEQIHDLARQINHTIANLTNIDVILRDTADKLKKARDLKKRADWAKMAADGVRITVQEVMDSLTNATIAQQKARDAINKAEGDISHAEINLSQIASETTLAQEIANRSAAKIDQLKKHMNEISQQFVRNEIAVAKAEKEAGIANRLAGQAENSAKDLEGKYAKAINELDQKATISGEAKKRAERLRDEANQLAHDVEQKLKELQELETEFNTNEKKFVDLSSEFDKLNQEMSYYLVDIESKSTLYRTCVA